jgi:hypothetical protein
MLYMKRGKILLLINYAHIGLKAPNAYVLLKICGIFIELMTNHVLQDVGKRLKLIKALVAHLFRLKKVTAKAKKRLIFSTHALKGMVSQNFAQILSETYALGALVKYLIRFSPIFRT